MLNLLSKVKIIDNTGGQIGRMIKRIRPKTTTKNSAAKVGDIILVSVIKTQNNAKIKRKGKYYGIVVRTKKTNNWIYKHEINKGKEAKQEISKKWWGTTEELYYKNNRIKEKLGGKEERYEDNAIVLIKEDKKKHEKNPIGTRIKGPISKTVKIQEGGLKLLAISERK